MKGSFTGLIAVSREQLEEIIHQWEERRWACLSQGRLSLKEVAKQRDRTDCLQSINRAEDGLQSLALPQVAHDHIQAGAIAFGKNWIL